MIEIARRLGRSRVTGAVCTLLVVAAGSAIVLLADGQRTGRVAAVAFAAGVTLVGFFGGWLVTLWPATTPSARVAASLAAMSLRIFPALVGLGWLQTSGRDLRSANAGELLVGFYLAALAVEIVRTIMEPERRGRKPGAARTI